MKILILTNKLPFPPKDGGSIATLNMLCGLQNAGNQLTCLALNTNKHPYPVEQIPKELGELIRFIGVDCDTSIRPLPLITNLLFSRRPYIAVRFNIRAFRKELSRLLQDESFHVIQLEGPYPGQYLDLIRQKSDARVSLRAHNVEHLIWERKARNESSLLKRWYLMNMARRLKRFELEIAKGADSLIPISEQDASCFRHMGLHIPMLTIPAGLVLKNYALSEAPEEASIFFIGALDWLPNQEGLSWFLSHVFSLLLAKIPEIRFHVAGRNAPADYAKQFKHPNIQYHGEVNNAIRFMQSYRVMVAPLLTGSGIRIKILEGMALGRPVVTTSAGIEGIPVNNQPCVAVTDDPEEFCSHIVKLIEARSDQAGSSAEARQFINRHFDTFELSNRLSQFYKAEE
jgi:glycosyltransferase involved in cell wall biosynthesis